MTIVTISTPNVGLICSDRCPVFSSCLYNNRTKKGNNYCINLLRWLRHGGDADNYRETRSYRFTLVKRDKLVLKLHNRSKEKAEAIITLFKLKYPEFTLEVKVEEK